jgi:hypothetical protein
MATQPHLAGSVLGSVTGTKHPKGSNHHTKYGVVITKIKDFHAGTCVITLLVKDCPMKLAW